ncbi:MAG: hypothetical protein NVS2B17_18930 [Candidatus Velthaea sp.]
MPSEPWSEIVGQERAVRLLRRALGRGQPHHAYLLAGPPGVGKELLARLFAQAANCEADEVAARPCGRCEACLGIARGNYPDVQWVMPLAELIARALLRTCDRLRAAVDATDDEPLAALRSLAGADYGALAKAAQRGRLRTVMRGGRYFTTRRWVAEYRATRSPGAANPES